MPERRCVAPDFRASGPPSRRFDRNQSLGVRATDRRNDRQRCRARRDLICDNGDRYLDTYYSDEWLETNGVEWRPEYERLLELTGS